jgi:hypothetical protein
MLMVNVLTFTLFVELVYEDIPAEHILDGTTLELSDELVKFK